MFRTFMLILLASSALAGRTPAGELTSPIKLEAGGKPIDTDGGHAAPWVADWNGDGRPDLLVGDYIRHKSDLPEPSPQQAADYARIRQELEPLQKRSSDLMEQLYGRDRLRDQEKRDQLEEEFSKLRERTRELRAKLPPEYETHGWVWLFLRAPRGT